MKHLEYRLHELDEAGGERAALLSDMGDTYPELRSFFARIAARLDELEGITLRCIGEETE